MFSKKFTDVLYDQLCVKSSGTSPVERKKIKSPNLAVCPKLLVMCSMINQGRRAVEGLEESGIHLLPDLGEFVKNMND